MKTVRITLCVVVAGCLLVLVGCGKKADESKPIAEVMAEAEKMDAAKLRSMAMQYKDAIMAKTAELDKVTAKLKEIPVTEQMGSEAKAIQADIAKIGDSLKALKDRFQVHYDKLKEKGGDTSGLEL